MMNPLKIQRLILISKLIKEVYIRDEEVHLEDISRMAEIPFIQLIKDIHDAIELDVMSLTFFRTYNVKYTQFVKRYSKSKGKTFKPVKYFGEWQE